MDIINSIQMCQHTLQWHYSEEQLIPVIAQWTGSGGLIEHSKHEHWSHSVLNLYCIHDHMQVQAL